MVAEGGSVKEYEFQHPLLLGFPTEPLFTVLENIANKLEVHTGSFRSPAFI